MKQAGKVLTPISIGEVTDTDLHRLISVCRLNYTGVGPEHILRNVAAGRMALLRFRASGLFVVQTVEYESGVREFLIFAMIGEGILAERKQIFEELKALAKLNRCQFIGGRAVRKGLARVYERLLRSPPQAVYFAKEL